MQSYFAVITWDSYSTCTDGLAVQNRVMPSIEFQAALRADETGRALFGTGHSAGVMVQTTQMQGGSCAMFPASADGAGGAD